MTLSIYDLVVFVEDVSELDKTLDVLFFLIVIAVLVYKLKQNSKVRKQILNKQTIFDQNTPSDNGSGSCPAQA